MTKAEREVIDAVRYWRSIARMEKALGERAPKGVKKKSLTRMAQAIDALGISESRAASRQITRWMAGLDKDTLNQIK